jgi:hypothetical protein
MLVAKSHDFKKTTLNNLENSSFVFLNSFIYINVTLIKVQ